MNAHFRLLDRRRLLAFPGAFFHHYGIAAFEMKASTILSFLVVSTITVVATLWANRNFRSALDSDGVFGGIIVIAASLAMVMLVGLMTFLVREALIETDIPRKVMSADEPSTHDKQA